MFLSFIGRRILSSFSLIRTAILVMGIANVLLFQYLDYAEAQERNKLAEQGALDHLSFVLQTQIQSYESAIWETGRLPASITSARDQYTAETTDDLQSLRKLDGSLLAPGGALHDFVINYLRLDGVWQTIVPVIEQNGDIARMRLLWTNNQALIANTPKLVNEYQQQAQQELVALQHSKDNAKLVATAVSIIISLISFVLSIALAIMLTRQIVPPVTRLTDALQQVAEGDLSPRAQVRGKDEISQLLRTFNSAVAQLHNLLLAVRGHALGISAESQRLRKSYAMYGEPIPRQRTVVQPSAAGSADVAPDGEESPAETPQGDDATIGVFQLIGQVTEVADSAATLAKRVRQAAAVAPPADPKIAGFAADLQGLDAEATQIAEQLHSLAHTLQSVQRRMEESTGKLDQAAEELRHAVEQFSLENENGSDSGATRVTEVRSQEASN
jgi:methyl-accepting chemotaxis protein